MPGKIAITPRSLSAGGHPLLDALTREGFDLVFPAPGRTPTEDDLIGSIPGRVGWLAGVEPVSRKVLARAGGLRVISRNGTGTDNIDMGAADALGIVVRRAASANARGVAELTIALMLASFRSIAWSDRMLREGSWNRRVGLEAAGKTLGVIGCGAIGRLVTGMALGLDMNVVASDTFPDPAFRPTGSFRYAGLDELFGVADVVTLHCPPHDRPIIDAAALRRMKDGAFLINTARADHVDEDAVLAALERGSIAAFATDVFASEPPELSPLLRHERTLLTPHAGGFTRESIDRATQVAVENLLDVLTG